MKKITQRIFLDYAAATPIDYKVAKEMEKTQKKFWANPSSLHTEGEITKETLEKARIKIARLLRCRASEIFFTSGGTESLNIAILGVIRNQGQPFGAGAVQGLPLAFGSQGSPLKNFAPKGDPLISHIIVSLIEHSAVLEPIKYLLKEKKIEVSFVAPNKKGIISPESIKKEIKENTVLVIVQHANSEIGTIQPIQKISKIIKEYKKNTRLNLVQNKPLVEPYFLVDAGQSIAYEKVSLERLGADLLIFDGIKIYGPKGMGILVVKNGTNISPIIFGGGQERGLKPGTENVVGAVGLAKALEITVKMREKESLRLTKLRDYAISKILKEIPNSSLNGDLENRLPNNINICFGKSQRQPFGAGAVQGLPLAFGSQSQELLLKIPTSRELPLAFGSQGSPLKNFAPKGDPLNSEFLVIKLDTLGFAVSAASACHTLSLENSSYVIESLGKPECASSSLRFTLGRDTKKTDLDKLIIALKKIIK